MGRGRRGLGSEPDFLATEAEQVHVIGGEDELTPLGDRRALLEGVLGEGERLAVDRLVGASLDDLLADVKNRSELGSNVLKLSGFGDNLDESEREVF